MSLVTKIVASAALPVAIVVGAAGASLVVLDHAGQASRRALARVAPVVRDVGTAHETLAALGRFHARWIAIGDPAYEDAWASRMAALDRRLVGLESRLETAPERRRLAKARLAVTRYRDLVAADRGARLRPLSVAAARRAHVASARAGRALDAITAEVHHTAQRAEHTAGAVAAEARSRMLAGMLVAAALALLFSSLVGGRVARGLRRLTDASVALERGRLDQSVAIGGRDELGRLAAAFEALAAGLGERDRVCEDTIRRLGHDIVEPLRTIGTAACALANDVSALPTHAQTLVLLIGEATDDLLRHADRIKESPTRPDAPSALETPAGPALPGPRPRPALIALTGGKEP